MHRSIQSLDQLGTRHGQAARRSNSSLSDTWQIRPTNLLVVHYKKIVARLLGKGGGISEGKKRGSYEPSSSFQLSKG